MNILSIISNLPKDFPNEFISELLSWENVNKSPYSHSYYDAKVDWGFKPHNSLRISDHWNFWSRGKLHCQTVEQCKNNSCWTLARYDENIGKYIVIKAFPKAENKKSVDVLIEMLTLKKQIAINKIQQSISCIKLRQKSLNCMELRYLNLYFSILQNN